MIVKFDELSDAERLGLCVLRASRARHVASLTDYIL